MTICYFIKQKITKTVIVKKKKTISSEKKTGLYLILWLQYKLREAKRCEVKATLHAFTQQLYDVRAECQP